MKLEQIKNLEVRKVGDMDSGVAASISADSMPFVFEMFSKTLYSNPIGSLIREITSNCFDAHVEAGIDQPVVIGKEYNPEEGFSITFKDVGVGLSQYRIAKIYMNYFSSTKRDTNDQIGGFGLGSKSPLSYTDLFYITSVHNGKKYECILHKGESLPTLESFNGWEYIQGDLLTHPGTDSPITITEAMLLKEDSYMEIDGLFYERLKVPVGVDTDENNGTVIKVNIAEGDSYKFKDELEFQLTYFDNVWFTKNWNINNDYDIYEGEYFKYRSDIDRHDEIHICIGNVRYPINFDKVDVPDRFRYVPIGVKFQIGELKVIPSREQLRYTDEGIALIRERIELATNELLELYYSQNPDIDTLEEFARKKDEEARITFNEEKRHFLFLWKGSKLDKVVKFKPLMNIGIKKIPKDMFFMYEIMGKISPDHKYIPMPYGVGGDVDLNFILNNKYVVFKKGQDRESIYTNARIQEEIGGPGKEVYIIRRKDLNFKKNYKAILELMGLRDTKVEGSKTSTIVKYLQVIQGIVHSRSRLYANMKPSDQWIADYKRRLKEATPAYQRRMANKIFYRDAAHDWAGKEAIADDLKERTGILVYGFKEDRKVLKAIFDAVVSNRFKIDMGYGGNATKLRKIEPAFKVIQIAKNVEKQIIGPQKTVYWIQFLNTRFFRSIVTAHHVAVELHRGITLDGHDIRAKLIKGYKEAFENVYKSIEKFYYKDGHNYDSYTLDEYTGNNYIPSMLEAVDFFKKNFGYKIPLINALKHDVLSYLEPREALLEYFKERGIRLRNEWYLKPTLQPIRN